MKDSPSLKPNSRATRLSNFVLHTRPSFGTTFMRALNQNFSQTDSVSPSHISTGTLHEDVLHLLQYLAKLFLEWEMFQVKVVDKIKVHILCSMTFFRKSAVYKVMSKNMVEPKRLQMAIWGALHAGLVTLLARMHTPASVHRHPHTQKYVGHFFIFHGDNGFVNAAQCYIICTSPFSFDFDLFINAA